MMRRAVAAVALLACADGLPAEFGGAWNYVVSAEGRILFDATVDFERQQGDSIFGTFSIEPPDPDFGGPFPVAGVRFGDHLLFAVTFPLGRITNDGTRDDASIGGSCVMDFNEEAPVACTFAMIRP